MKTPFKIVTIILTAALALGTLAACNTNSGPAKIGEVKIFPKITGGDHTKSQDEVVTYDTSPPVGGRHAGTWQNCGIYDSEIRNETAVHALEHGAVWITYKPDLAETDKIKLRQMALSNPYILLSPYPSQDVNLILTAWEVQLKLNGLDDAKVEDFLKKYMFDRSAQAGKEPKAPEFGAQCAAGTGQPRQ
jgi:predicted small secreted protein